MGKITTTLIPFTKNHTLDKELVMRMLQYETTIAFDPAIGHKLYDNMILEPLTSLNVEKILNRLTLMHFNFDTTDVSVETYRTIFRTYYQSPTSYDADVINASYYMKNNKTVFYNGAPLMPNAIIPNVPMHTINTKTKETVMLHDVIDSTCSTTTIVAAFSLT